MVMCVYIRKETWACVFTSGKKQGCVCLHQEKNMCLCVYYLRAIKRHERGIVYVYLVIRCNHGVS